MSGIFCLVNGLERQSQVAGAALPLALCMTAEGMGVNRQIIIFKNCLKF